MKENEIMKWLLEVEHPAKGDKNLVELGMVEKVEISAELEPWVPGGDVSIDTDDAPEGVE